MAVVAVAITLVSDARSKTVSSVTAGASAS